MASGFEPGSGSCAAQMTLINETENSKARMRAVRLLQTDFINPPKRQCPLGVNSALANGISHAVDGQHIGCDAIVDAVSLGITDHVSERRDHNLFQLLVDHGLFPEIALPVLNPLEVGSGDATGIGENIRNDKDSLVSQDIIGGGS